LGVLRVPVSWEHRYLFNHTVGVTGQAQ